MKHRIVSVFNSKTAQEIMRLENIITGGLIEHVKI